MKINLVILLLFATGFIWGQNDETNNSPKWQINFSAKAGSNYHFKYAESFLQCVEGCRSVNQDPKIGYGISAGVGYLLNRTNELYLDFGYSQHRFKDFSQDNFSGPDNVFETDIQLNFINLGLAHRFNPGKLFVENQVMVDLNSGGSSSFSIKDTGLSYQLHVGLNTEISDRVNLLIGPYFKSAMTDYFRYQQRYYPYSLGIKVSTSFKL